MKSFFIDRKRRIEKFLNENRTLMLPIIMLVGFIGDTLTLNNVDQIFDNTVLVVHLLIVATSIALLSARNTSFGARFKVSQRESTISALMLFSFGGLFSGFTIFYAKSGSLISSWPFILLMLLLMLGTEVRKNYYQKLTLQISIFYVALFSYLIFSVPVILRLMGPRIYILSGILSLIIIYFYIFWLKRINYSFDAKKISLRIISIFFVFNLLYFTNIIPPIPLSLKETAVFHNFSRIQATHYEGYYEKNPNWMFWDKRSSVFHRVGIEDVFVFSSVYAPAHLNTDIIHRWEYFDQEKTRWVETDRIKIPITGGRNGGYRGFSKKNNVWPGSWRVKITTDRNQTIGQILFKVKEGSPAQGLVKEIFD